ncbi:hypothetical protein BN1232_00275 [Mycobacterium lentiflavum]|uniref:DUF427 domain-containing protein n=1 Tax=Mycobacterium lentiflavum TaxID=141349 RepID=A0A0E3WAZ7_MYCLN|nr:DUF427 domain-containing protein [Mycobacterium lentiflavum]CQD02916.1 hypothetical protein BN1232_00275 [Mycobacterium lentiflavum]
MKASIDGVVVADAPESDLVNIEGNYYFPPSSLDAAAFSDSPTSYTCPWKGSAQYHDVSAGGSTHHDAAWSYPDPYPSSFARVGRDYSHYVAFDREQVTIG